MADKPDEVRHVPICRVCGSKKIVNLVAHAWNIHTQTWNITTSDSYHCEDCDDQNFGPRNVVWVDLNKTV